MDDSPVGESGCGGTDEFTISSSQLEEFDGCYVDAGETEAFFSTSGEKADGLMAVFSGFLDEQETADVSVEEPHPVKRNNGKQLALVPQLTDAPKMPLRVPLSVATSFIRP